MYEQDQPMCPETCTSNSVQYAQVQVPMDVVPYAEVSQLRVQCCSEPTVETRQSECGCRWVITQSLRITVPVAFGVRAEAGTAKFVPCPIV